MPDRRARAHSTDDPPPRRRRRRGLRPWLIQGKHLGLVGFLGGLLACGSMWAFGPRPDDQAGWLLLKGALRAVFFPCVFCGLLLTIAMGIALYARHWREFNRMRWFRVKAALLVVVVPASHLTARGRVTALYAAIEADELERAAALWAQVGVAFLVTFVVMLVIAAIGRMKPRFGERIGVRRSVPDRVARRAAMLDRARSSPAVNPADLPQ